MNAITLSLALVSVSYIGCEFNKSWNWNWVKLIGVLLLVVSFIAHLR